MLDVKTWILAKLKADSALVAALGASTKIVFEYPEDFSLVPILTYSELNQADTLPADDVATAWESQLEFHVWTANGVSTTAIAVHVARVLNANGYEMFFGYDVPEPDVKFRHRVLRFSRSLTGSDLI